MVEALGEGQLTTEHATDIIPPAGAATFPLAAWRPPLRPRIWIYALYVPIGVGPIVWISWPLMRLGVPPWPAIATGALAWFALLGWFARGEFSPRRAGTLSVGGGRLRCDAWGRRPIDVPLSDVRKAILFRVRPANVLRVWLRGGRSVLVHEPRLGGARLEEVAAALHRAMDAEPRARAEAASEAAVGRGRRWARIGAWAGAGAVVLALVRLVLEALLR